MPVKLTELEVCLINLGFEEERRFHYSELVDVSKEIVERMKGGLIEKYTIVSNEDKTDSLDSVLYVRE